jgi:hypothetical protein
LSKKKSKKLLQNKTFIPPNLKPRAKTEIGLKKREKKKKKKLV